jgi:hypothetical protein
MASARGNLIQAGQHEHLQRGIGGLGIGDWRSKSCHLPCMGIVPFPSFAQGSFSAKRRRRRMMMITRTTCISTVNTLGQSHGRGCRVLARLLGPEVIRFGREALANVVRWMRNGYNQEA